jgi:hypothetical protein
MQLCRALVSSVVPLPDAPHCVLALCQLVKGPTNSSCADKEKENNNGDINNAVNMILRKVKILDKRIPLNLESYEGGNPGPMRPASEISCGWRSA